MREDYIRMLNEALERQETERVFREGQNEQVPQPQDFFTYWNNDNPVEEYLNFRIDDWD